VNPSITVKAIATAPLFSQSGVGSATYTTSLTMLPVAGGTFNNGTSNVTLNSFTMSKYEVTQAQYQIVTGNSPSYFTGDTSRPVEQVTWYDAVEFCNKLSEREGLTDVYTITGRIPSTGYPITGATSVTATWTNNGYRLPTEAQWEYAARGGVNTHGYAYAGSNTIDSVAWYLSNSGGTTHAVGGKLANELGLYDLSGNVWEWCYDWYATYPSGAQTDPTGAASGTYRINRGGCWVNNGIGIPMTGRDPCVPNYINGSYGIVGFRVVRQ
jgi:formylglycine-generating enzyme required for sulfatase activity